MVISVYNAIFYAKSFLGKPYIWGGDDPIRGFDCSGLVQEILASVGVDPKGDQTAQALYGAFDDCVVPEPLAGCLAFYGRDLDHISHVAFCISDHQVIEAAGGGSKTKTVEDAVKHNAFIRIRPVKHRLDFLCVVMPRYRF